ncbi:hypothetical protein ACP3TI_11285, partial [Desulforudis sp. 1190]
MPTTSLLGARIDALSMREALEVVTALVTKGHPSQVITMNPEYLYRAQREPLLLDIANGAALVTADEDAGYCEVECPKCEHLVCVDSEVFEDGDVESITCPNC